MGVNQKMGQGNRFYFIIGCHWDLNSAAGQTLRHAYETLHLSVGLGGHIFERDFDHLGKLAEPCWFTHTWQLCHRFSSPIKFAAEFEVPSIRQGDKALMDSFIDTGIWQIEQLEILNRVRRYKCAFFRSDILQPDGRTVLPSMMDKSQGTSNWTFPREKPTGKNIELWQGALQHLTSENLMLQQAMGPYVNKPHKLTGWYLSSNSLYLYKKSENGTYDTYRASPRS